LSKNYCSVKIEKETYEQIKYLSNVTNKKMSVILAELVEQISNVASTYKDGLNLSYQWEYNTLVIEFSGSSRLALGVVKAGKSQQEMDNKCLEAGKKALGLED
jgi:hypothetical protein